MIRRVVISPSEDFEVQFTLTIASATFNQAANDALWIDTWPLSFRSAKLADVCSDDVEVSQVGLVLDFLDDEHNHSHCQLFGWTIFQVNR